MSMLMMRFSSLLGMLALLATAGCGTSQAPPSPEVTQQPAEDRAPAVDTAIEPMPAGDANADASQQDAPDKAAVAAPTKEMKTADSANNADQPKETSSSSATSKSVSPPASEAPSTEPKSLPAATPPPEVAGLRRLDPKYEVWIDPQHKRVFVGGQIARREGQLEMFACLKNTKEHESVVAANTKAFIVNSALIALGADPGKPVQFRPAFKPAHGPEVEVTVIYTDADGERQQVQAQEWIRNIKSGKPLDQPWVFGGSGFWKDESTGTEHFMAEDGDFICISNFHSAMLDLPVESSQASAELMFEAFTERIPPENTPVLLVLTPKLETKKDETKKDVESKKQEENKKQEESEDEAKKNDSQDAEKKEPGDAEKQTTSKAQDEE